MDHNEEVYEAYGIIDKLAKYIERLENALVTLGYAEMLSNLKAEFEKENPSSVAESQNTDENEKNPMLIQNIVENVCQYLNYQNLQNLRLVHPCWDKAIMTQKRLQNTKMVMKFASSNPSDYNGTKSLNRLLETYPIEQIDTDPESGRSTLRPVPKTVWISKLGSESNQEELVKWFRIYGKTIKCLELGHRDSDFSKVQSSRLFELLAAMPNLEELQIQELDFKGPFLQNQELQPLKSITTLKIGRGKEIKGSPEDLKNLLRLTTNLKVLKLWIKPTEGFEDGKGRQEDYLQICCEQGYIKNLTHLDLSKTGLSYPSLKLLESALFIQLKFLALGSIKEIHGQPQIPHQSVFDAFSNLFRNVQLTLEHFSIKSSTFILKSLPLQMKVEVLEIHDFWILEQDSMDERITGFLTKFPDLKSLVLNAPSTMHVRYLPSVFILLNPQFLLTKVFPTYPLFQINSLSKLELINTSLEETVFKRIVQSFPELTFFTLISDSYDEGDLIWELGSFLSQLALFNRLEHLDLQLDYRFGFEEAEFQFNEAIADHFSKLHSLKKFTYACKRQKIKIQEKAVIKGFAECSSLRYLELQNFKIEPEIQSLFNSVRERIELKGCIASVGI